MHKTLVLAFLLLCNLVLFGQRDKKNPCAPIKEKLAECKNPTLEKKTTSFPASSIEYPNNIDYHVLDYQVKVALPIVEEKSRVWVKGSINKNFVQIFDESNIPISEVVELEAPYHIEVISIDAKYNIATIKFSNQQKKLSSSTASKTVYPKSLAQLNKEENFSILFYGCFQPFTMEGENSALLDEGRRLNYKMRKTFELIANEKSFEYKPFLSENSNSKNGSLLSNPKLIIGTGDQIYTDADYHSEVNENTISAWAHKCNNPYNLLDKVEYSNHLNRCYSHFYSFDCFRNTYDKIISLNVWDDHEIRDGWGSHGDEYDPQNDQIEYYKLSREAYIKHQYAPGPNDIDKYDQSNNHSLQQKATINGKRIFAFDLRSNRDICKNQVIDENQLADFFDWCDQTPNGKEVIIISSIPLFYEQTKTAISIGKKLAKGELTDDIADAWSSDFNIFQRNQILEKLIQLRERNIKPIIVSGDVHIGGLITVYYKDKDAGLNKNKKLCYQLIYSGLSHHTLGEKRKKRKTGPQKFSELPFLKDPTIIVGTHSIYPYYEFTRPRLNFGALEFLSDKTIASLFIVSDDESSFIEYELELSWNDEDYKNYTSKIRKRKLPTIPNHVINFSKNSKYY